MIGCRVLITCRPTSDNFLFSSLCILLHENIDITASMIPKSLPMGAVSTDTAKSLVLHALISGMTMRAHSDIHNGRMKYDKLHTPHISRQASAAVNAWIRCAQYECRLTDIPFVEQRPLCDPHRSLDGQPEVWHDSNNTFPASPLSSRRTVRLRAHIKCLRGGWLLHEHPINAREVLQLERTIG